MNFINDQVNQYGWDCIFVAAAAAAVSAFMYVEYGASYIILKLDMGDLKMNIQYLSQSNRTSELWMFNNKQNEQTRRTHTHIQSMRDQNMIVVKSKMGFLLPRQWFKGHNQVWFIF